MEEKINWEKKQEIEDLKSKIMAYWFLGGLLFWTIIAPVVFWYLALKYRKQAKEIAKEIGEVFPWWL